jgi:hypothetical protein
LIDSGLSVGIVHVPMSVHHIESFTRVGMIEAQAVRKPIRQVWSRLAIISEFRVQKKESKLLELGPAQEIRTSLRMESS